MTLRQKDSEETGPVCHWQQTAWGFSCCYPVPGGRIIDTLSIIRLESVGGGQLIPTGDQGL